MDYILDNYIRPGYQRGLGIWRHQGFQKYFRNTGWLITAKIISFVASFFTITLVARYLGPENLGKLEYAQSFVAIMSVFASLGIDQIVYRDLIAHPEKERGILGTSFLLKIVLGTITFFSSILISSSLGNDEIYTILIGICSLTFIISPVGILSILFNSKVKSKYVSMVSIFISFFIPLSKIIVILLGGGIIYFALTILAESIISASAFIFIYIRYFNGNPFKWYFSFDLLKEILKNSWPLFVAGLSGYVYAKMDQVMILHYLNPKEVGIYGAAVKITQIWAFIPGLIIGSLFPAIVNSYKTDFKNYAKRIKSLLYLIISVSLLISIPIFFGSWIIIRIIFGPYFLDAVSILQIYVWVGIAINLVVLAQHFLVVEKLEKIFLYSSLIGAITNIILNIMLIPKFGPMGAALGTLISYTAVVFSLFLFKHSRDGILRIIKK